ncbi:hypothetical protein [Pseudonocardia sp.]|uniref:hypothetical protein n=1 Tax=Pseudonocardia sp. TaxID=60912 RepID=UPI003D145D3F
MTAPLRSPAALLGAGGVLLLAGGPLHPDGSGATVEEHLASMLTAPTWGISHLLLLAGSVLAVAGFVAAWRGEAFGPRVTPLLPLVIACWTLGVLDAVPHLLASHDHAHLVGGAPTPILDVHLVLQTVAVPAVGLTGALVAAAVAWSDRTVAAVALGAVGVLGGLGYAAAGLLVPLTWDVRYAALFPLQTGLAIWLIGTAARLAARSRTPVPA